MRFRVTFQQYPKAQSLKHGVTLEENDPDPGDGDDCWSNEVSVDARSKAEAIRILKEHVTREYEERMRAIEAAQ